MVHVDKDSPKPFYRQIYEQIKNDIIKGNIKDGSKLVSTRALAKALCVSRNTVEYAYAQLYLEGYVLNKPRSGYVVQKIENIFSPTPENPLCKDGTTSVISNIDNHDINIPEDISAWVHEESDLYQYNFHSASFSEDMFPYSLWNRMINEALRSTDRYKMNFYNDKQGEADLRNEIMEYLGRSRGVHCNAGQIVVCSGTQYALDIICHLIAGKTKKFAIEEPANGSARDVIANDGYEILPIPVNNDGIDINALKISNARAVLITPSHQFPTGVLMPIQNRIKIIEWAKQRNAIIVEDDFDSELRYHSGPIPSLQSIDNNGRVVYLGTFSKALSPDLRVSYMVLPLWLMPEYHRMFARYRPALSWLQQKVLCQYIKEGHWERHIRRLCLSHGSKHDLLVKLIKNLMGNRVIIHGTNAGTHIILEFTGGEDQTWLIKRAKEAGVKVYSTMPFWYNRENCPKNTLLIGFSRMNHDKIVEGITLLKKAWFD